MEFIDIIGFAFAITVVGGFWIFQYFREKKRTELMQSLAQKMGFGFSKQARDVSIRKLDGLALMDFGRGNKFINELYKPNCQHDSAVLGHRFRTGHGKNSRLNFQTLAVFDTKNTDIPDFEIKPENKWHKIGKMFWLKDIEFEQYPKFCEKYLIKGNDEQSIKAFLTAEKIHHLESLDKVCIESRNGVIVYYIPFKRRKPEEIEHFYQQANISVDVIKA